MEMTLSLFLSSFVYTGRTESSDVLQEDAEMREDGDYEEVT